VTLTKRYLDIDMPELSGMEDLEARRDGIEARCREGLSKRFTQVRPKSQSHGTRILSRAWTGDIGTSGRTGRAVTESVSPLVPRALKITGEGSRTTKARWTAGFAQSGR
jgi:hypothetical protein